MENGEYLTGVAYLLVAGFFAYITGYPPNIPPNIISSYDYPIFRIIGLTGIIGIGLYSVEMAILGAIGYGIVAEDIVKTSTKRRAIQKQKEKEKEGFENKDINMIHLLPGPADLEKSKNITEKKTANIMNIQATINNLQEQVNALIGK
jgi:hypothetical protein